MRAAKIQLKGQFAVDRRHGEPLSLQIVRQLQAAIEGGRVGPGTVLPSSRALARALRVSRNTVLVAYEELKARNLIRGRPGAGMRVAAAASRAFDVRRVVREAHYPARSLMVTDPDGNPVRLVC